MTAIYNAMTAVAYAEVGERDTARQIMGSVDKKKKRVIFGVNDITIKPVLINHAYDLSQRINGHLEILQILTPALTERTYECMNSSELQKMKDRGIAYKIITGLGSAEEDLLSYARENSNIQLVLLASAGGKGHTINALNVMSELHCPVVVFSEIM